MTPAPEFELTRFDVTHPRVETDRDGPEILLCTEGQVRLRAPTLQAEWLVNRGQSVFVAAEVSRYELSGAGVAFRTSVP